VDIQGFLDLGTRAHVDALHGRHEHHVFLAGKRGGWWQEPYPADLLPDAAAAAAQSPTASYISQSGFTDGGGRRVADVAALTSLFVDLDYYKHPAWRDADFHQLVAAALKAHPDLPPPTVIADSGRGAYLEWIFAKPLPAADLARWQFAENALISMFAEFGVDGSARDAARVLRLAGSWHESAKRRVRYFKAGRPVSFATIERVLLGRAQTRSEPRNAPPAPTPRVSTRQLVMRDAVPSTGTVGSVKRMYQLHHDRLRDFERLALLRAPMTDGRRRMLYAYAVSLAWYVHSERDMLAELHEFARRYFAAAALYTNKVIRECCSAVLSRYRDARAGYLYLHGGAALDPRYRHSNVYLLDVLEVTDTEQRQMHTIITQQEKARRRHEREATETFTGYCERRKAETERKRQQVRDALRSGLCLREIAQATGLSERRVRQLASL